jgi:glycosyltransferase involved in cell wall biosynthesis
MSVTVLHVAQPSDGGVASYLAAAARDQAERGWHVVVACPDGGRLAGDLTAAGLARLPWPALRSPGRSTLAEALRLRALMHRIRPDAVHLHSAKAGLAGRLGPRPAGVPVLFQPHGWSWLAAEGPLRTASLAWERVAARRTDLCLCVSDTEAREGRAHHVPGRYAVVRNGVDLSRFRPADRRRQAQARDRLGVPAGAPLAVCVGRLTRQKGQDILLDAWPAVVRRCPAARLALVGDGDLQLAPRPGVIFAGAVDDVRDWLAAADVVVLPSRWEGLSLSVLEALAVGRPVVVSDIPGLAEAVAPGTGRAVSPGDPAALADALAERLGDLARARTEGEAAARHALRFDQRLTFQELAAHTLAAVAARRNVSTRGVSHGTAIRRAT